MPMSAADDQPPAAPTGHGEYKTPGGKMVVADVTVVDDHLRNVVISGDFFLYPEEVLAMMTNAIEGQPAAASRETLTTAVAAAVPPDAELFGFSPEAVAIAIRRALGHDLRTTEAADPGTSQPESGSN